MKKSSLKRLVFAAMSVCAVMLYGASKNADDVAIENARFRLTIGADAIVKSLVAKHNGEELLSKHDPVPFCSVTQLRPFNNEIKLIHPHRRTVYPANRIRREGDRLVVGFEIAPYDAVIKVKITDDYAAFELSDFILTEKSYPLCPTAIVPLDFTAPPVEEFRIVQLPVKDRENFGEWLNVQWDGKAAVGVFAASEHAQVRADRRTGYRLMGADALRSVKLRGTCAVVTVDAGNDAILDRIDALERDYSLPSGVKNRRNRLTNASIYFMRDVSPETIDRHIKFAKRGGFKLMEMTSAQFFGPSGDYVYHPQYPNGAADVKEKVIDKIRAAGLVPGMHILHTFVNMRSRLVREGDRRLMLREHYTLAKAIGPDDDVVYVDENPMNAELSPKCKLLKFGREIMSYEAFTTEPPYRFTGVKRGVKGTACAAHEEGLIGGTLWICEYGGNDIYIKQDSDLQDIVAGKVAELWKAGFGFIYFDGSEGTHPPYGYHVPNAQYRMWKKLVPQPILGEGAAKAHFGWHMLSGANAFDVFSPEEFKAKIDEYPAAEAPLMKRDFSRVNFGWWGFWHPGCKIRKNITETGVQSDMWEYGTSKAAAWDSPMSVQMAVKELEAHPRTDDILEVMRRWEDVRDRNWLTKAQKEALRVPGREFHLYLNDKGEYELHEIKMLPTPSKARELRGFVFERGGKRVVSCWHTSGEGSVKIALGDGGRNISLRIAGRRYIETDLSASEVEANFAAAEMERRVQK